MSTDWTLYTFQPGEVFNFTRTVWSKVDPTIPHCPCCREFVPLGEETTGVLTLEDVKAHFNSHAGSKWEIDFFTDPEAYTAARAREDATADALFALPALTVIEVCGRGTDRITYAINDVIGEDFPVITETLIHQIIKVYRKRLKKAMGCRHAVRQTPAQVEQWLRTQKGRRLFCLWL